MVAPRQNLLRFPNWKAAIHEVDFDLLATSDLNPRGMRGPDQYFGDPVARARSFLRRFAHDRYFDSDMEAL
jgi:hypothetical protein